RPSPTPGAAGRGLGGDSSPGVVPGVGPPPGRPAFLQDRATALAEIEVDHLLSRVVRFKVLGEYRVYVEFDDGTSHTIDLAPILRGEVFGPLRDPELFRSVT